jgi:hypothetical protein
VFPVKYELNVYIIRRNLVFKGLNASRATLTSSSSICLSPSPW